MSEAHHAPAMDVDAPAGENAPRFQVKKVCATLTSGTVSVSGAGTSRSITYAVADSALFAEIISWSSASSARLTKAPACRKSAQWRGGSATYVAH